MSSQGSLLVEEGTEKENQRFDRVRCVDQTILIMKMENGAPSQGKSVASRS